MSPPADLPRFGAATRAVHWATACLALLCIGTAAILYNGSLSLAVGHRPAVRAMHVYAGCALPLPMLIGLVSAAYRDDARRLNRWSRDDRRWLIRRDRRDGGIPVGKFNAGQKLNAALSCGAILVLLGTGLLMRFPDLARLSWRTGATFVHDWTALALGLLIIGHLAYAARDPQSRRGMLGGRVSRWWAEQEHAGWAAELTASRRADAIPPASAQPEGGAEAGER